MPARHSSNAFLDTWSWSEETWNKSLLVLWRPFSDRKSYKMLENRFWWQGLLTGMPQLVLIPAPTIATTLVALLSASVTPLKSLSLQRTSPCVEGTTSSSPLHIITSCSSVWTGGWISPEERSPWDGGLWVRTSRFFSWTSTPMISLIGQGLSPFCTSSRRHLKRLLSYVGSAGERWSPAHHWRTSLIWACMFDSI